MFNRYNARGIFLGTTKIATALELGAGRYTFTTRSVIEVLDVNDVRRRKRLCYRRRARFE